MHPGSNFPQESNLLKRAKVGTWKDEPKLISALRFNWKLHPTLSWYTLLMRMELLIVCLGGGWGCWLIVSIGLRGPTLTFTRIKYPFY